MLTLILIFDLDLDVDFGHPFSLGSFGCESVNK